MDTPRRGRGRAGHDVIHELKTLRSIHSYQPYNAEVCVPDFMFAALYVENTLSTVLLFTVLVCSPCVDI